MEISGPTLPFYIHYKNGKEESHEASSFEDLQNSFFGSKEELNQKVKWISWKEKTTLVTYSSDTGEFHRTIADGDVNPYGWRMQHR
ncbi:MAG TPA: hypothetical protein VJ949_00205 [Cryomorphaceae bacterium]|nr:hypothetical protein [Cryomorphaceae bacterium]